MEKVLASKLIAEMARVRDDVMPSQILADYRGSRVAGESLQMLRDLLDQGVNALAEQNGEKALEVFGELKAIK